MRPTALVPDEGYGFPFLVTPYLPFVSDLTKREAIGHIDERVTPRRYVLVIVVENATVG
jgi:hypothetical protein